MFVVTANIISTGLFLIGRFLPIQFPSVLSLVITGIPRNVFYIFIFFGWVETESTWYVGQYLDYFTSPG
jgi:hypothetical protein